MIPRALGEIISVSRKAAKGFKQSLEELGELLREAQLERNLQRSPVRVPVHRGAPQHPLSGRVGRRQFSTSTPRFFTSTFESTSINVKSLQSLYRRQPLTNTFKNAIYQVQPFRVATRVTIRGGAGSSMYKHFVHHNARMYSTFGSSSAQAVQNLSQGIRTFVLKGGQLTADCLMTKVQVGNYNTNEMHANEDMNLAAKLSNDDFVHECGSFIEFNINTASVEDLLPASGLFDEDLSKEFENRLESALEYQRRVISDISLFRENIGSTSFKCSNGRLRFYCPNCEVPKMELMLLDHGITTGVVYKMNEKMSSNENFSDQDLMSRTDSFESVLSAGDSFSSIDGSERDHSILSMSDNYFEEVIIV